MVLVELYLIGLAPQFVTVDSFGETILTDYALTHMDECCLIFELSVRSGSMERYHAECFLNREKGSDITYNIEYSNVYQNATPEKQAELLKGTLKEENKMLLQLTNDYRDCIDMARKWRNVTYEQLGKRIYMDESAARRIVNGKTDGSINTLVLICLALHLPFSISSHIIDKSPHSLNLRNESYIFYQFALIHLYPQLIEYISAFLKSNGADPL